MGGGSKSTSVSGSAQKWAQPFAKSAAGDIQGVWKANRGNNQALADQAFAQTSPLWARFNAGNDQVRGAQGYASDVLAGKYLEGNPYLQNIINATNRGVTDQVNSQFSLAGRYGSGAHTGVLARELADSENNLRYQDYGTQQQRMDQIAALAPTLAQADYIGLPEALQTSQSAAELPYAGATNYANALAALFNGGTQTQKQGGGLGSILGSIASIGATAAKAGAFSDRRLKTDIEKIGEYPDGLGQYEWTYVWGGPRHRGVMADEVSALRPWALGPVIGGYATVNYGAL